jgi:hypothetical protein
MDMIHVSTLPNPFEGHAAVKREAQATLAAESQTAQLAAILCALLAHCELKNY